jgi:glutathione peroxidase
MSVFSVKINGLANQSDVLASVNNNVVLVVNVASKCGLTPQYTALEALHKELAPKGFSVFGGQEPGSAEEITTFCSTNYGVTFPMTEKVDVNGNERHPLYDILTLSADADGHTGDIRWNFEKFLVGKDGSVVGRFSPMVAPDDASLRAAIQKALG